MKCIIKAAVVASAVLLTAPAAYAEVIGEAVITDIGAFIDYLPISSYNVDGSTYIQAEDLRSYGFDVVWDESARTLDIIPNGSKPHSLLNEEEISIEKSAISSGEHAFDIYATDITTRICGEEVTGCSLNGVMLIKLRDLERCAYISFDETYRTASAEVTRYTMEKAYEAAPKNTLDLGDGMTYTGEVANGVPNGIGRIVQTGTESIYSTSGRGSHPNYNYDHDEDYVNTYTGRFENGVPNGVFFTVTRPVIRLASMYQHNGMEFLSTASAVEFYSVGTLMSSAVDVTIPSEEYVMGTPARGPYSYVGNNQYKGLYYFNSINGTEYCYLWPSAKMLYGGSLSVYNSANDNLLRHRYIDESVKFVSCGTIEYYQYAVSEDGGLYVWEYYVPESDRTFDDPLYIRRNVDKAAAPVTSGGGFSLSNYKVLARDNKLYIINNDFNDSLDTLVRENVAETERDKYLTTDGNLYFFDASGWSVAPDGTYDELIDTNVARINDDAYIKNDGSAWAVISDFGEVTLKKLADKAIDVYYGNNYPDSAAYISDKGELFYCGDIKDETQGFTKIADNAARVKISGGRISYMDTDNNLYRIDTENGVWQDPVLVSEDVKDFDGGGMTVVTNDGKLWDIRTTDGTLTKTQLFAHKAVSINVEG